METKSVLIVGEAPGARLTGRTRDRITELAGRPWEEWADFVNVLDDWPGRQPAHGRGSAWDTRAAKAAADRMTFDGYEVVVLLGRRVAGALIPGGAGLPWFREIERRGHRFVVMPHTSGVNAFWNDAASVERAREFLSRVASGALVPA